MSALLFWMAILGCDRDKEEAAADSAEATLQPDPSSWSGSTLTGVTTSTTETRPTEATTAKDTSDTGSTEDKGTSTATTHTSTSKGTGPRTVTFAGREWWVKSGEWGPGPNHWSDSAESVWVDDEGSLHLVIREIEGEWHCAEVYSTEVAQYGVHRFYVDSALDDLDANAVFAPFLYANDETEIDIEFTRWGNPDAPHNGQYVVQPYSNLGNLETFPMSLDGTFTTHAFDWQADSIRFTSLHGHYEEAPSPGFVIHDWLYEGADVPEQAESLRIHINLWLYQGRAPARGEAVSVIVRAADLPVPLE